MSLRDLSTVVMPVAHRPEFAALALERLAQADYCPDIMVFIDDVSQNLKEDFRYVLKNYAVNYTTVRYRYPHLPVPSGCWNILNSICDGYRTGASFVFLIEEDVMIKPNFFISHWSALETHSVSCGRKLEKYPGLYTNPGSAFNRRFLWHLTPHINNDYFRDPGGYLQNVFPGIEDRSVLDDGLIRRVAEATGAEIAFPEAPLCGHQGMQAYRDKLDFMRIDSSAGIEARIENLRGILQTTDPAGRYTRDFEPI